MARRSERTWFRMTRRQRAIFVVGACVALVGLVLALTVHTALGSIIMAVGTFTMIGAQIFAPPG
ncbi:hypothetical protein [Micromonospora sp. D93]|uniref:hypothetical protein n=1 Tax=Micromonospora TaxID=1873 RepID=UPI001B389AA9|nr:hypothetical protein [Micromonospora sp. D93]MBQ1020928.1 hypothetical protein [Micromonospora sp. D93]